MLPQDSSKRQEWSLGASTLREDSGCPLWKPKKSDRPFQNLQNLKHSVSSQQYSLCYVKPAKMTFAFASIPHLGA